MCVCVHVHASSVRACMCVIVVSVIAMGRWALCKSGLSVLLVVVVLVALVVLPCNVTSSLGFPHVWLTVTPFKLA